MKVLKLAYPAFYSKFTNDDVRETINLWSDIFAADNAQVVTLAVRDLIQTHTGFPPEIADVRKKINDIVRSATGEPTDEEYWLLLRRALADGNWGAQEQFDRLPAPLQRYCGSASWLRDHARMDTETIDSVIHGQFLRQFPRVKEAQEYHDSLPEGVRQAIAAMYKPLEGEHQPLNEYDFQIARNRVVGVLEGA